MPNVSFLIIAYNEECTIRRCLDSILAQNNLDDYEIIIVDDGSKDQTAKIVQEYADKNSAIFLHRMAINQGRGAARAASIKLAQGRYFAFVDADIALPPHWLSTCLEYMTEYDAVGGIAVPDGDVNYVYGLCNLKPKVANPTTIVSGSNGFYKRDIFKAISFKEDLRDGEDVVFNKMMVSNGFKIHRIRSLVVEHKEARGFFEAMKWLYQTGCGATRQFKQFKELRLPDVAYFVLVALSIFSLATTIIFRELLLLLIPIFFILCIDIIHFQRKFFFEPRHFWRYFAGVMVYWLMLGCYFVGRTSGWFMPVPKDERRKKVLLCFDFEGELGMPFQAEYNLAKTARCVLSVLDKYDAKAVFFVVGKIIEEQPELIKEIVEHGHEIALHGYEHEHLDTCTKKELAEFDSNLSRVENSLEKLTGKHPSGFRAPFLLDPVFYTPELYDVLKAHDYRWASNRSIRHEREFLHPRKSWVAKFFIPVKAAALPLFILLNWRFIFKDSVDSSPRSSIFANLRWLLNGMSSFERNGIMEIPAHSPFDSELVGLPHPDEPTSQELLDYAVDTLVHNVLEAKGDYSMTFHDWIIGSSNRTQILERVLTRLSNNKTVVFVLPNEVLSS